MKYALRLTVTLALLLLLWPELGRYRAEYAVEDIELRIDRVLRGADRGDAGSASVDIVLQRIAESKPHLPADPRLSMYEGVALVLRGRGAEAVAVLQSAIAIGERPELTINLGRALASTGDEASAQAAFLHTAWASPAAIATLPKTMRATLLLEVERREIELRAGRMKQLPSLPRE